MKYSLILSKNDRIDFKVVETRIVVIEGDSLLEVLAKLPLEIHNAVKLEKLFTEMNKDDDIPF